MGACSTFACPAEWLEQAKVDESSHLVLSVKFS
jgi:hypothetical protein